GDEAPIDAVRTAHNAVLRRAAAVSSSGASGGASGERSDQDAQPLLAVEDFVVAETERRTSAAVALLVDLSFSMIQEDRWAPMKQTALALSHLISTRYRSEALQVIGFDRTARRLSPLQL